MCPAVMTMLRRTRQGALLAFALSTLANGTAADPQSSFSDRLDVVHVDIDLMVTDSKGRPVTDLGRADLELYRDGRRQEILHFARPDSRPADAGEPSTSTDRPRQLVIYVDNLRIWPKRRDALLRRMAGFVEQRIARGDLLSVVAFDGGVELLAVGTRDAGRVLASLEALESRPSAIVKTALEARHLRQDLASGIAGEMLRPRVERYVERLRVDAARSLAGLAATLDVLAQPSWSTSVLYLSDGIPAWPGDELAGLGSGGARSRISMRVAIENDPTEQGVPTPSIQYLVSYPRSSTTPRRTADLEGMAGALGPLIELANGRGVAFYPVRPSSLLRTSIHPRTGAHAHADHISLLARLAQSTGGDLVPYARFETALARLSHRLDSAYTVGFEIPTDSDHALHTLEIQLARKGLKAHYRRGLDLRTDVLGRSGSDGGQSALGIN